MYGYQTWSKELLVQAKNNDNLCGGQRSTEVKYGKQCSMATKLGQKNMWCKLRKMMTFVEVQSQQRWDIVINVLWLQNLVKRTTDASLEEWWLIDLHIGQRSTEVKYSNLCSMATKLRRSWWYFHRVKDQQFKCGKYVLWLPLIQAIGIMMTFMKVANCYKG